jgi:hypothetical protein
VLTADLLKLHAAAGAPDLMTKCLLAQPVTHPAAEYSRRADVSCSWLVHQLLCAYAAHQALVETPAEANQVITLTFGSIPELMPACNKEPANQHPLPAAYAAMYNSKTSSAWDQRLTES